MRTAVHNEPKILRDSNGLTFRIDARPRLRSPQHVTVERLQVLKKQIRFIPWWKRQGIVHQGELQGVQEVEVDWLTVASVPNALTADEGARALTFLSLSPHAAET